MKKEWSLIVCLALLLAVFAGCGGQAGSAAAQEPSVPAAESDGETVQEAAEEPAAEPVAEPEAAGSEPEGSVQEEPPAEEPETRGDPFEAMRETYFTYPLEGENNTISYWYFMEQESRNDAWITPYAEAATGIHVDYIEVARSAVYEQFNLMIASGDMPDLIPCNDYYTGGLSKAYEEDIILNIGDYMDEYMPNYKALLDTLDPAVAESTRTDGMTLAFAGIKDGTYSGNGMVTRGDWLEQAGYRFDGKMITLDQFTDLLRLIHDDFAAPYPYYFVKDGQMSVEAAFDTDIPMLADSFMASVDSCVFRYGDEIASGWVTDGYRDYLEWILSLMDEELLYRDFLSLDDDRMVINRLTGSGQIGVWVQNADKMDELADFADEANADFAVTAVPRVVRDVNEPYVWNDEANLVTLGMSLSGTCRNPELCCQWQNYFYTEDGYILYNYGIQGTTVDYNRDTHEFTWLDGYVIGGDVGANAELGISLYTMKNHVVSYEDNDRLLSTLSDSALAAVEMWTIEGSTEERYYPTSLKIGFDNDETAKIAEYEPDLITYAQETVLKFLDGSLELNDENWEEYKATCESLGLPEILKVYQDAYDQHLAGER